MGGLAWFPAAVAPWVVEHALRVLEVERLALYRPADGAPAVQDERVGPCQLASRDPTFETLARSITFQQLHGKAAATIFARVRKATGRRAEAYTVVSGSINYWLGSLFFFGIMNRRNVYEIAVTQDATR